MQYEWTCDCGEEDCEECGTSWARKIPEKRIVKEWNGVRLMEDGTYEIDF